MDMVSKGLVQSSGCETARRIEDLLEHEELTRFLENAAMALHWVGADGTILWANRAELKLLGYTEEEYIGRSITEFHVDEHVSADILNQTGWKEVKSFGNTKHGTVRRMAQSGTCPSFRTRTRRLSRVKQRV